MAKPITVQQQVSYTDGGAGGTLPQVTKWTVALQAGRLPKTYSVEIPGTPPADLKELTIEAGLGGSTLVPVLEKAEVQTTSGEWRQAGYVTTLTGVDGADPLIQRAPEKTLIFLARDYIDKHAKGYEWRLNPETQLIEGYYHWKGKEYSWTIRIQEIPSDPQEAGTFTTVVVNNSRQEVLDRLAGELGIEIRNGCPVTPFRGAYVLQDTQTYFDAIRDQVSTWNPLMVLRNENDAWALYILDVEDGQTMPGGITVKQHLLTVYAMQRTKEAVVNLATITGAERDQSPSPIALFMPPRNRKPLELSADYTVERWVDTDPQTGKVLQNCPTWKEHSRTRILKEYARDPADVYNRILIREEVCVYGEYEDGSDLVAKKITTYHYLDYTAAIGQDVEEWQRVRLPGSASSKLTKVKETRTDYGDYVDGTGEIERLEVEEGLCAYDWQEVAGQGMRLNPQEVSVAQQNQTLDLSSLSAQSYQWATIRRRQTRYDVEDSYRVRRDTVVWNNLDGTAELETEYIPISYENRQGSGKRGQRSTWRFEDEDSIAAYGRRTRVELSLSDLKEGEDDALAQELWERIRRKSGAERIEARIGLPIWAPVMVGEKLTVAQSAVKEWDRVSAIFTERTLPGGDYYVTGVQHAYETNQQTREARLTTTLTVRSTF